MKKTIVALGALCAFSAHADYLGLFAGVQGWQMGSDGSFGSKSGTTEFSYDDQTNMSAYLAFEHLVPLIPNVKVKAQKMRYDGSASGSLSFAGNTFNGSMSQSNDYMMYDGILYYQLLDNPLVEADFGLDLRYLDGEVSLSDDSGNSETLSFTGALPQLYVAAKAFIPTTGISFFAEVSGLEFDDNRALDGQLGISWEMDFVPGIDISLQGGYRKMELRVDDFDSVRFDQEFEGVFAGVEFHI